MDLPTEGANLLAQPTRARLFQALEELRRAASTEELAARLDLHPNGVRRQLVLMNDAGLLTRSRRSRGRGRPRDEWSIAPGASPAGERPEAYAELSGWLARAVSSSPDQLRRVEEAGREIGREIAPSEGGDPERAIRDVFSALGFQPAVEVDGEGSLRCTLCNCPYRASVRDNPEVVCTLHKGITLGLLDEIDPSSELTRFEPHDPDRAGCLVEVAGVGRDESASAPSGGRE
ncbi:MAG: helix-turn-helix transcriptional regulator [Solirubrobacterales bacterium]